MIFRTALAAMSLAAPAAASDVLLGMPLDCQFGITCFIQNYVDRDPGPGARDFRCGTQTNDGHDGTDFALPTLADMQRGVNVLASAPGIVLALRDGEEDRLYTEAEADRIKGRECGNGVLIGHEDGWQTQYCHMRNGSITVQKGQQVARGDVLGQVGLSGLTQFPHVHLSVRKDGEAIDPFDKNMTESCDSGDPALWTEPLAYHAGGLIAVGFAPAIPEYDAIRAGTAGVETLGTGAPALVVFGYAHGGQAGDEVEITITGPEGEVISEIATLDRDQAQFFRAAGKKRPAAGWAAGRYVGSVELRRNGERVDGLSREISLR